MLATDSWSAAPVAGHSTGYAVALIVFVAVVIGAALVAGWRR